MIEVRRHHKAPRRARSQLLLLHQPSDPLLTTAHAFKLEFEMDAQTAVTLMTGVKVMLD